MKTIPKLQDAWSKLLYHRPLTLGEYVSGNLNMPEYWLPNIEVIGEYNLDNEDFPWIKRKIEIDRKNRNEKRLAGEYYSRIPDSKGVAQMFHNTFQALRHGYNGWVDPETPYNSGVAPTPGRARIKVPKVQYFNGEELGRLLFPNRKSIPTPFNEKIFRVGVNLRPRSKNPQISISTGSPKSGSATNYDFDSKGAYKGFSVGYEKFGGNITKVFNRDKIVKNQEGNKINRADYSKPNKRITASLNGKRINLTVNEGQLYGEDPINIKGQTYYLTGDSTLIRNNQNKDSKKIANKIVKDQYPAGPITAYNPSSSFPSTGIAYTDILPEVVIKSKKPRPRILNKWTPENNVLNYERIDLSTPWGEGGNREETGHYYYTTQAEFDRTNRPGTRIPTNRVSPYERKAAGERIPKRYSKDDSRGVQSVIEWY